MKIVVIIPSRYGSSRFEGKPIAIIDGKPMIQHVYESAKKALEITDVWVATDDERIFNTVKNFGGKVVMTSPNNRSGTDRVAEAAKKIGIGLDDIVINAQGDQPFFNPACLNELTKPFFNNSDVDMTTLAFKIINEDEITNPKDVKVTFDNKGFALYFSRSPIPYNRDFPLQFDTYKHLGFYAYKRRFLETFTKLPEGKLEKIEKLEQLRALEYKHRILIVITNHDSPEVDTPEDIVRIEKTLKTNL